MFQMEEASEDCKDLGLPNTMNRSKVGTLDLLDKVKKRVLS